jgi:hypothetical protein
VLARSLFPLRQDHLVWLRSPRRRGHAHRAK